MMLDELRGEAREDVLAAALAALPGATALRLHNLLEARSASEAYAAINDGVLSSDVAPLEVLEEWQTGITRFDLGILQARIDAAEVRVSILHDADHPLQLKHDIDPAAVLFRRGNLPDPGLAHVAVVGTRRATAIGREVARQLGFGLAQAGVVVVSGLALGIDGEAHRGALLAEGAAPVAVVGSGVDVVYPKRHADLWQQIAECGAVVSEAPIGANPEPWRFPARNRLIAAFADLVVVVESRRAGGSLLTVEQAMRRDIDVMAVPGSVRNRAAEGTNALLVDGCAPARDVADVLVALGLSEIAVTARRDNSFADRGAAPNLRVVGGAGSKEMITVLEAIDDGPTSIDEVLARTGLAVFDVSACVEELVTANLVTHDGARVRRL
ncbi:MAG: DNA-protecting protein DprA [Acidimicrobiia bacterium]|nr:DNA-protecting protein DprA [Acidimicrobiia bacterium]